MTAIFRGASPTHKPAYNYDKKQSSREHRNLRWINAAIMI